MSTVVAQLLAAALAVASLGTGGAGLVAGAGLVVLLLGHRVFRPVAGLAAAGGLALLVAIATTRLHVALPVAPPLAIAGAAVLGLLLGLVFPVLGTVLTASALGLGAGLLVAEVFPASNDLALLFCCVGGALVAGILWSELPTILPPVAGAALMTLGAWGAAGASGAAPKLFRLPAMWVAILGVLVVAGIGVERARFAAREKRAVTKKSSADADAAKRRDAEQRARYAKYLQ
jgi:hypothetical protein